MFAIAAVNGTGCRDLVWKLQDWLDAHPAVPQIAPGAPDGGDAEPTAGPGDAAAGATDGPGAAE